MGEKLYSSKGKIKKTLKVEVENLVKATHMLGMLTV
jgi:hypothetical protein